MDDLYLLSQVITSATCHGSAQSKAGLAERGPSLFKSEFLPYGPLP